MFRLSPHWQTQGPFFPADGHFGSLLSNLRKEPEVYIWRPHPQQPNGFKRHPEYSSFLPLWAPWQFPPKVKAAVNSEVPFSEYQFILNSSLIFFLLLSSALELLRLQWMHGFVWALRRQDCLYKSKAWRRCLHPSLLAKVLCTYSVFSATSSLEKLETTEPSGEMFKSCWSIWLGDKCFN